MVREHYLVRNDDYVGSRVVFRCGRGTTAKV